MQNRSSRTNNKNTFISYSGEYNANFMHTYLYRNHEALQGVLQGIFSQISKAKLVSILKQLIIKLPYLSLILSLPLI